MAECRLQVKAKVNPSLPPRKEKTKIVYKPVCDLMTPCIGVPRSAVRPRKSAAHVSAKKQNTLKECGRVADYLPTTWDASTSCKPVAVSGESGAFLLS